MEELARGCGGVSAILYECGHTGKSGKVGEGKVGAGTKPEIIEARAKRRLALRKALGIRERR